MAVKGVTAKAKKDEIERHYCAHSFSGACKAELDHLEAAVAAEADAKPGELLQTSRFMASRSCDLMTAEGDKTSSCVRDVAEFIDILRSDQARGE